MKAVWPLQNNQRTKQKFKNLHFIKNNFKFRFKSHWCDLTYNLEHVFIQPAYKEIHRGRIHFKSAGKNIKQTQNIVFVLTNKHFFDLYKNNHNKNYF